MQTTDTTNGIAARRIAMLVHYAETKTLEKGEPEKKLARRYVELAKKISSKYQVTIPKALKNKICKKCGNILIPGLNCSVRMASSFGYMAYVCECGEERHIFYKKKRA